MFTAKPVTHYHRHRPAPSWDRQPDETLDAKLERIAGDHLATFGPERSDRPAHLTTTEKAAIAPRAANWLRVGPRVRLVDAPGSVDPAFGIQRYLDRYGVVWRLCRSWLELATFLAALPLLRLVLLDYRCKRTDVALETGSIVFPPLSEWASPGKSGRDARCAIR
nr:hypothetical protein [Sphingomonas sp. CARO-RG-8B-R24-01]